jgi:N-acetylneuraminic acid mutarotase
MYVLGGMYDASRTAGELKFVSTRGTWSEVAAMPESRWALAACALGSDIYVFGGYDINNIRQNSIFKYDTVDNAWSTLAPMPTYCVNHSVSVLEGLVYIVGAGVNGRELLRFDPVYGVWITLAPTAMRCNYGASFVLDGCVYVVGGVDDRNVERYDVTNDTSTIVANMLEKREDFAAVTTGSKVPAEEQDLFDSLIIKAATQRP